MLGLSWKSVKINFIAICTNRCEEKRVDTSKTQIAINFNPPKFDLIYDFLKFAVTL